MSLFTSESRQQAVNASLSRSSAPDLGGCTFCPTQSCDSCAKTASMSAAEKANHSLAQKTSLKILSDDKVGSFLGIRDRIGIAEREQQSDKVKDPESLLAQKADKNAAELKANQEKAKVVVVINPNETTNTTNTKQEANSPLQQLTQIENSPVVQVQQVQRQAETPLDQLYPNRFHLSPEDLAPIKAHVKTITVTETKDSRDKNAAYFAGEERTKASDATAAKASTQNQPSEKLTAQTKLSVSTESLVRKPEHSVTAKSRSSENTAVQHQEKSAAKNSQSQSRGARSAGAQVSKVQTKPGAVRKTDSERSSKINASRFTERAVKLSRAKSAVTRSSSRSSRLKAVKDLRSTIRSIKRSDIKLRKQQAQKIALSLKPKFKSRLGRSSSRQSGSAENHKAFAGSSQFADISKKGYSNFTNVPVVNVESNSAKTNHAISNKQAEASRQHQSLNERKEIRQPSSENTHDLTSRTRTLERTSQSTPAQRDLSTKSAALFKTNKVQRSSSARATAMTRDAGNQRAEDLAKLRRQLASLENNTLRSSPKSKAKSTQISRDLLGELTPKHIRRIKNSMRIFNLIRDQIILEEMLGFGGGSQYEHLDLIDQQRRMLRRSAKSSKALNPDYEDAIS